MARTDAHKKWSQEMAKTDGHLDEKVEGEGRSFEDAEVRNARADACVCVLRDQFGEPGHFDMYRKPSLLFWEHLQKVNLKK